MSVFSKFAKIIAAAVLSVVVVPLGLVGRLGTSVCHRLFPRNKTVSAAHDVMKIASELPLVIILSGENYGPP